MSEYGKKHRRWPSKHHDATAQPDSYVRGETRGVVVGWLILSKDVLPCGMSYDPGVYAFGAPMAYPARMQCIVYRCWISKGTTTIILGTSRMMPEMENRTRGM